MRLTIVAAFLAISSHSNAQGWSITAHAPIVGTVVANVSGSPTVSNSATLPVGPVQLGTFLTCSVSHPLGGSGSANMSWIPSVVGSSAPLAFTAQLSSASAGSYTLGTYGSASGNARIELTLHAPQPVGGLLRVRVSGSDYAPSGTSASSRIDLDVNADGTIEVSAQTSTASTPFDLPLQVSATGAVIRLSYNSSTQAGGSTGWSSSTTARTIEAQFFPGEPIVAPFATFSGAAAMSVDHSSLGTVTLSIAGPGLTPVLMAFGGTPISVPLWPSLTVLVSPDVVIGTTGSITLQLPPLPPGALFAQGLVIDSVGTLRGTNSVRFQWL